MKVKCFSTFITSKILNIPFNGIDQHPHTIQSLAEICCYFSRKRFFLFLLLSFVWIFPAQCDPITACFESCSVFLWLFGASCGLASLYCLNPCLRLRLSGTAAPTQNLTETLPVHLDRGMVHTEERRLGLSQYISHLSLCVHCILMC